MARRRDPGTAGSLVGHLEARLDESDRGRLQTGQDAIVRIEAIPGREFKARINNISVLAKIDFTSGWPPPKNFDLNLVLIDVDPKIRPGMTAVARIATERIPDVVLVPAEAIFQQDGAPNVYRLAGSEFVATRVEVKRRGRSRPSSPRASIRGTASQPGAGARDDQEGELKKRRRHSHRRPPDRHRRSRRGPDDRRSEPARRPIDGPDDAGRQEPAC